MEMNLKNTFFEMNQEELEQLDGGIGLLTAALICGGCFVVGALGTVGVCCLIN